MSKQTLFIIIVAILLIFSFASLISEPVIFTSLSPNLKKNNDAEDNGLLNFSLNMEQITGTGGCMVLLKVVTKNLLTFL